ncbi:MAG: hypothetical protein ACYC1C_21030, partial [Chloroflexota bacterium]
GDNLWALPILEDWNGLERIHFDRHDPWFARLLAFNDALVEHARGRYPVGVGQLMLGPIDMMLSIREQSKLALDLYDAPEMVAALGSRCVGLCAEATEALFQAVPAYLGGYAGTIRYFWAPGKLVETAEDIAFMLSPALHKQFIVPLHRELGQRFPYTIVHLHSAQLHTVANLLEVDEVAAIEITPDFGEDMRPYLPVMGKILERKPLIVHGVMTLESVREMMRSLPARGLALFIRCDSPGEARTALDSLL